MRLNISTRSGKVRVTAAPGAELSVAGGTIEPGDPGASGDGEIRIRRSKGADTIEVQCADDTDVTVGTASGNVDLAGRLGAVRVATVSGKVHVADADRVDARAKSGSVDIAECRSECRVVVTSSKVHVGRAASALIASVSGLVLAERVDRADVKTVSGKVFLGVASAGRVRVHTVSGRVEIAVPAGVRPSTRLHSISGRVRSDCEPGTDGEISVATVSGSIQVTPR